MFESSELGCDITVRVHLHDKMYMNKPDVLVMECSRKKVINLSRYIQNISNPTE